MNADEVKTLLEQKRIGFDCFIYIIEDLNETGLKPNVVFDLMKENKYFKQSVIGKAEKLQKRLEETMTKILTT